MRRSSRWKLGIGGGFGGGFLSFRMEVDTARRSFGQHELRSKHRVQMGSRTTEDTIRRR